MLNLISTVHKQVHFIGIGGISMSALAQILLTRGVKVSGSDSRPSPITARLAQDGAEVRIGHGAENIKSPDLVVYTAAIADDNPELLEARRRGIAVVERADFLGALTRDYTYPVAVSGTHGKTTVTAMLSCVLLHAGYNPTVLVGGELSQINGNFHVGGAEHLIFEACEYVDSFLKFHPFAAIVLNVEEDHLDYFSGIAQIKASFRAFLEKIPNGGFAVLNSEDENVMRCAEGVACEKILYGANGAYRARNVKFSDSGTASFTADYSGGAVEVALGVRGVHNVSNALAVFAAASRLGVTPAHIADGLADFTGTRRRFEYKGAFRGAAVYDDYAHHPTEITATLNAAKNIRHNKIWCVFQPHTYSRTKALLDGFAESLAAADRVIITDVYAAREPNDGVTRAETLAEKIKAAEYISDFHAIAEYLKANVSNGDLVITMGAGTITELSGLLV
ncbi:MAG: UDP-N-acetylmuramate--L-alanine ligase [Clostridiales bacterium]|jgi:UDP-N-acetylmuramate--alanine ligase|nr:UDP-N-acetylmuramate--L-alanine ligase [Clostridiales bacterium]